jgi:chemotaxis protein methyltransferase CheR
VISHGSGRSLPTELPELRPEEYRLLRDLLGEKIGHAFNEDHAREFERRLRPRVSACGLSTFAEYHRHLRGSPKREEELQTVYDILTNNETYFFREDYQLRSFREEVLPRLERDARHRKQLTCWSMGCSTGEEAYSIAMVLLESGRFDGWSMRVLGTDLSRKRITFARRGIYGESSFRSTSKERRGAFFVSTRAGTRVCAAVRSLCQFGQLNVMEMKNRCTIDQVDAVFCRNVLIYFTPQARAHVMASIFERLRPGGFLMLGHSESLLHDPGPFQPVHLKRDVVYRRPTERELRSKREGI